LKTNTTTRLSGVDYLCLHPFYGDWRSFGQFWASQKNAYSSWREHAIELGLPQIEREQFSLSNGIIGRSKWEKFGVTIPSTTCPIKTHLIGQLLDQSNFTCFDAPEICLLNGENRSSLRCSYQKLFKKHSRLFYFEMDIRSFSFNNSVIISTFSSSVFGW
jgi:hypothetical protein